MGNPRGDAWWYPTEGMLPGRLEVEGLLRDVAYSSGLFFVVNVAADSLRSI